MARKATGQVVIRERKEGRVYALRFRAYGERRYVTLGTAEDGYSREKAEAELRHILADVERGVWAPHEPEPVEAPAVAPTFREFASEWFDQHRREVRETTVGSIEWLLTYLLLPYFAEHRLSAITAREVDRYRQAQVAERDRLIKLRDADAEKPKDDRERLPRPLANRTINRSIALLAQVLDVAVEYELIDSNPARGKRRRLKADKPQRPYLDAARQVVALLDAAGELDRNAREDRRHVARRAMLATLVFAGLRVGELVALRWRDVDVAGGWLHVGQAKTDAGRRKVKIRPALRDEMLAIKPAGARAAAPVFATSEGKAMSTANVRNRVLAPALRLANERADEAGEAPLPEVTPHGLRRSFASILYALGESPPVVMAEMGHTDPALALAIYAQAMRRDDDEDAALRALVNGHHWAPEARLGTSEGVESLLDGTAADAADPHGEREAA